MGWLDALFGLIADLTIQDQEKNEQLNATWLWALVGIVARLYVKSWELTYTIRPGKKESRTHRLCAELLLQTIKLLFCYKKLYGIFYSEEKIRIMASDVASSQASIGCSRGPIKRKTHVQF